MNTVPTQASVSILGFIAAYTDAHGIAPTPQAIAHYFGIDAIATVTALAELNARGIIAFDGEQLQELEAVRS